MTYDMVSTLTGC